MSQHMPACAMALGLLAAAGAWSLAGAATPTSPRNASYTIEVRLDERARMLHGRQVVTWRNLRERPASELWFHLYWNAWRNNRSTWMLQDRLRGRSDRGEDIRDEDWSYVEVQAIRLLPDEPAAPVDLTPGRRFEAPDDGNADDRTVMVVALPNEVGPGDTVRVEMDWRARIPRTFARTGYRGDFYFFAHWFPKLGVWEPDGWSCHQFHATTEFYSDYGVYDVSMTVPSRFVLGATGREVERRDHPDGTVTHRYRQEDVHAFSWTVSPDYLVREARFEEPGLPPVDLRLLIQPEHLAQAERHFAATRAALLHFGTWYGPYPYGHLTLVDPAWGSGAGGMEYPTLFTCGTRLFHPFGGDRPESVTVHEAGHQFWYGLVGNDEFRHAWIDEGLNTFSTLRTLDVAYGPRIHVRRYLLPPGETDEREGFVAVPMRDIVVSRWQDRVDRYRPSARSDDPSWPTFAYFPETAGDITYSKTALWLATLERHLGWDVLRGILSTFFERHRFGHPGPEDFFAVADEIAGQDLGWFFDQVYRGSAAFDYAIDSVSSRTARIEGWVDGDAGPRLVERSDEEEDENEAAAGERVWRTEVVVQRRGGAYFPVQVLLVFEDGERVLRSWDGRARWTLLVEERSSELEYAVVDPDHVLLLDLDRTNNSMRRKPASAAPARKWGSKWMIWLQDLLSTFALYV